MAGVGRVGEVLRPFHQRLHLAAHALRRQGVQVLPQALHGGLQETQWRKRFALLNAATVPFHADLAFVLLSVDKSVKKTTQRASLAQKSVSSSFKRFINRSTVRASLMYPKMTRCTLAFLDQLCHLQPASHLFEALSTLILSLKYFVLSHQSRKHRFSRLPFVSTAWVCCLKCVAIFSYLLGLC